jgi:hypothetical protein
MLHLDFTPDEVGKHLIAVTKKGKPVKGSPFAVDVAPEEPTKPTVGNKCGVGFDIPDIELPKDLKDLKGKLIKPNGQEAPIGFTVSPQNQLGVEFLPDQPGEHKIVIAKKGVQVAGSPFVVEVASKEETIKRTVGEACLLSLEVEEIETANDLKDVLGKLTRPSGRVETIKCSTSRSRHMSVEFVTQEVGKHTIEVVKKGKTIKSVAVSVAPPKQSSKPTVGNKCGVDFDIPDVELPKDLKNLGGKVRLKLKQKLGFGYMSMHIHNRVVEYFC